jgi:hypothetical protein
VPPRGHEQVNGMAVSTAIGLLASASLFRLWLRPQQIAKLD